MVRLTALPIFAFGASAASYDHDLARRLVNYAGAAYCASGKNINDWSCIPCQNVPEFQLSQVISASWTDSTAIVGYDPVLGARIVAFMGTNANLETWIDDVNVLPSKCYRDLGCDSCNCHPGFYNTYQSINSDIISAVDNLPAGKLIITGHSLGAAQAMHCAIHLYIHGVTIDHIYTVGQPRVGNTALSDWYDNLGLDHWRITHHRDPIPHLPWRGIGNYKQILKEAWYKDADASAPDQICDTVVEDTKCADQFNDELTTAFISDHWSYLGFSFSAAVLRCTFLENNATVV